MATGYTKAELDMLLHIMDEAVPPIPIDAAKTIALRVTAMRASGTEKGLLLNLESKDGTAELFWLNCRVAKELAGAINFASQQYGWAKRGMTAEPHDHLKQPQQEDLNSAIDVLSLSTSGIAAGILVRFAVGEPVHHLTMYFPRNAALEILSYVVRCGAEAAWWDDGFELIPSRENQH